MSRKEEQIVIRLEKGLKIPRPLQNVPFRPISASGSNFNPQNTQCIPAVKVFAFLELERNRTFCKGLIPLHMEGRRT